MESFGSVLAGDWSSSESESVAQLLDHCSIPNDLHFNSRYYVGDFNHILAAKDDFVFCNEEAKDESLSSVQILSSVDVSDKEVVISNSVQKSNKRSTNSGDVQVNKRSVKAKKNQKIRMTGCMNNRGENAAVQTRRLRSCSSENDSIASHELNGVASNSSADSKEVTPVNSNSEVRAVRGSATDPQSLYAKKRRERINEKLRTLQNLDSNLSRPLH